MSNQPPMDADRDSFRAALLAALAAQCPKLDRDRVAACYDFAATAHGEQRRRSGEPFVSHPVQVVLILAELLEGRLDMATACAALLHDVVEDTPVRMGEIERRFGVEVAALVEGATKLEHLDLESSGARQTDYVRGMIFSMSKDVRVILIKLADRLHNMRTIDHVSLRSAIRSARESMNVYAALADLLGIRRIKRELEDLSFRVLYPLNFATLSGKLAQGDEDRWRRVEAHRQRMASALKEHGIRGEVTGRAKHLYSIFRKTKNVHGKLETMNDLMGLRVIVATKGDCYRALGVVHNIWEPFEDGFRDYIARPKANMYESLHTTVLTDDSSIVEVQIRTWEMHRTAETGLAAHYVYKRGGAVDVEFDRLFGKIVSQLAGLERAADEGTYIEFLRTSLHQEEVFAYTPRRELKRLAKGATPLDFAFLIHTEVGQHTEGARVNGELVPLRYELKNGDTVEIITSPQARPHDDWLQVARTPAARAKIRAWLRQQRHDDSVSLGAEMLERELKRLRLKRDVKVLTEIAEEFGCDDVDAMYARVAEGQIGLPQIVRKLQPEKEGFAERLTKAPLEVLGIGRKPAGGVRIQGVANVMVTYARCCQPVPGDPVIGIVTVGRGVSVHRQDCPNTFRDPGLVERRVAVEWDSAPTDTFPVRLLVRGNDRPQLLADIAKAISACSVNIRQAGMASEDKTARGVFVVEVPTLAKLNEVLAAVRRLPGVTGVERRQRLVRGRPVADDEE